MESLRWSPSWAVEPGEPAAGALVLSGGADRRVAVDGLGAGTVAAVRCWAEGGRVDPADGRQHVVVDRLVALGALAPVAGRPGGGVVLLGDAAVTASLGRHLGQGRADAGGGLVVAVRTGATWPAVPAGAVHLGLDLALHHTIVLGPLVVPGASACLGCLDRRVAHRWPAPVVPARPGAVDAVAVAAALLHVQARLAAAGTSPLVNATTAWDLERGTADRQALWKLSGCPTCDHGGAPDGRVALPHLTPSADAAEPAGGDRIGALGAGALA